MRHARGRAGAAAEACAKDARRRQSAGDDDVHDAGSNAKVCGIAPTTKPTTRKRTRENLLEKVDDEEEEEKERSSRGTDAMISEATMGWGEEVEKRLGNLGDSTSVELSDELEDLSPRFLSGEWPSADGLGVMRAPDALSVPMASLQTSLPVSAINDDVAIVAMLAYDVYIEPTSGRAFVPTHGENENDSSSLMAPLPTMDDLVSSSTMTTTTTTTTTKSLGDARARRREYERLRSAERRHKQTPEQRERERIRSRERRARMTDEQRRAVADAKFQKRAALKASRIIEDRARLR